MSVFISWAGDDREVKNVLAEKLREEKIEYFDSDEHCVSNFSEECIRNIRNSSVFIVIVSEASMDPRSYVRNEIIEARRRENDGALNILVYKITDEPYNEFFTFNLNHISDANHVSRIQRAGASGIDTLIKRTKHLLALREVGTPEKPLDVLYPRIIGTPVSIGSYLGYFVDRSRDEVLDSLNEAFERSNTVILSELFGFGKKSVIRKFATSGNYNVALELEGMHETLSEFFVSGLKFSNVSEEAFKSEDKKLVIRKKFELLSRLNEKHIIIISDVDIESEPDEEIIKQLRTLKCHVAIITQNAAEEYRDFMPVISVGRMETEYLAELFFHYFDRSGNIDKSELLPTLEKFFDGIGGHTKTVELAASVLAKEMVRDAEEIKSFLSVTESGKTLVDRIVAKLGSLIDLEKFGEEEKKTLLILALTAMPTISLSELFEIADAVELDCRGALKELAERRWITLNSASGTVYIEPIISRLCVAKIDADAEILGVCFSRLSEAYLTIASKNRSTAVSILTRLERFLALTGLDAVAPIVSLMKAPGSINTDTIEGYVKKFIEWYRTFRESFNEENEIEVFYMCVSAWTVLFAVPMIETSNKLPLLMNLSKGNNASPLNVRSDTLEELASLNSDPLIEEYSDYVLGSDDAELSVVSELYSRFIDSFNRRDYESMSHVIAALLEALEDPEISEDKDSAMTALMIAKVFANTCSNTGAYRTGIAVLEKLIPIDFDPYVEHQLLMLYVKLLMESGDTGARATTVMDTAEEMLSELCDQKSLPEDEMLGITREHTALYALALAMEGECDLAMEKLAELMRMGAAGVAAYALDAVSKTVDRLLYERRRNEAVDMIAKYRDFFFDCENDEMLSELYKEEARSCLALLDFSTEMATEGFKAGGITENESYYQRYSREKKNGMFKMMAYNKVADAVKRFKFEDIKNEDFPIIAAKLRERAKAGEPKMKLAAEAFALVSEAGMRALGYRHHYVQYVGAAAMLDGKIAEILNGEGKTYTVTLAAFVQSLYFDRVFVLDESKYLTERNYKWMRGVYSLLGVEAVHVSSKNQYTFNMETETPTVFYSALTTFGFSMNNRDLYDSGKRGILSGAAAIVDEADTILVEMASTALQTTSSKSSPKHRELCGAAYSIAKKIYGDKTYYTVKNDYPELTDDVKDVIEDALLAEYDDVNRSELLMTAERLLKKALYCFGLEAERDYFVRQSGIFVENSRTGEMNEVESEKGYFIARKEGTSADLYERKLQNRTLTANQCYVYGLLKRFGAISGTSATASSFKKEFKDIYGLEVISIPPALPIRRRDLTVSLFISRETKDEEILNIVTEKHGIGQPILIIARNVRASIEYSNLLTERGIPHKLLNAVNSESSPEALASAGEYGSVLVATQIANRGVDIKLGGDPERKTLFELCELGYDLSKIDEILYTVPSEEMRESELYRVYSAILEKNRARAALNKERVIEAGGLCVIGTEPYDNLRIEQQVRGRSGRQGAVGESYIFESVDDEFFRYLITGRVKDMLLSSGDERGLFQSSFLTRSIEKARERIHHKRFKGMRSAKILSERIEESKEAFFALMEKKSFDDAELEELLYEWAKNEENLKNAEECLEKEEKRVTNAPIFLKLFYKDIFNSERDEYISDMLYEAALAHVRKFSFDGSDPSLASRVKSALTDHLTAMGELEDIYSSRNENYSDKFFREQYLENRKSSIASAVDKWLIDTAVKAFSKKNQ